MSNRRRMLMAIANQFKWLPYSYEYLYHDLVPETIDSKSVKNKAKVSVIEANGVVENQLVQNGNFEDTSGWTSCNLSYGTLSVANNTAKITMTTATSDNYAFGLRSAGTYQFTNGHKILVAIKIKSSKTDKLVFDSNNVMSVISKIDIVANQLTQFNGIATATGNSQNLWFYVNDTSVFAVNDTLEFKDFMCIDLTLMFGTGNEPTTLTDNRIQALLNRGYIPYNTGTYKGTDIGLFSSEPYNLFDGEWEQGSFDEYGENYANATNNIRTVDFIPVVGGRTYNIECGNFSTNVAKQTVFWEYDENFVGIKRTIDYSLMSSENGSVSFTLLSNTRYIRFNIYVSDYNLVANSPQQFSFHLQGTRTGYAPHKSFTPIAFRYQGNGAINAHDTMTITKDNVVFGKNDAILDLSSLSFGGIGNNVYYATLSTAKSNTGQGNMPNIACSKYTTINAMTGSAWGSETKDKVISLGYDTARVYLRDTSISQTSDIAGTFVYELATPQTITIPRKHLGVVDLGSVSLSLSGGYWQGTISGIKIPATTSTLANIYCVEYLNDTYSHLQSQGYMAVTDTGKIIIKDSTKTQASDFTGVYLFYETQDEVADILDTLDIEAGGTVNANWFSWVENQQFIIPTISSTTTNGVTLTNNGDGSVTIQGTASANTTFTLMGNLSRDIPLGHKVLITNFANPNHLTYYMWDAYESNISYDMEDSPNGYIKTKEGSNTTISPRIYVRSGTNISTPQTVKVMYFDLTQAFGAGNEPISVNDPRIQYVLNKGYIPTNTTGTYKLVDCEVLPNVEFKVKCK